MRANQFLDGFSQTLMQDQRILSSSEKELLASILHNAGNTSAGNPEIQSAVTCAIHRAVGETVAQRAFTLLGSSIVEQILSPPSSARREEDTTLGPTPPPQPSTGPAPPAHVKRPPQKDEPAGPAPPSEKRPPMKGPAPPNSPVFPPGPGGYQPLKVDARSDPQRGRAHEVEVLEAPVSIPAKCVVLDEFLAPQQLEELVSYTTQHQSDFQVSEVLSPTGAGDVIDYNHRRSLVLMDLGKHHEVIVNRIKVVLPHVLAELGMEPFPVTLVEMQITASNDGDFFRIHCDSGQGPIASRQLTFVYFFHREPSQFEGGELHLHDANLEEEQYVSAGSYQTIVPQQNQIVFFPSLLPHEITPVKCPSHAFADSRFTVNGWLRN